MKQIVVDPFCFRQFSEHTEASQGYKGLVFTDMTVAQMEEIVNQHYNNDPSLLRDGYASFCKHLFLPNTNGQISQSARVNVLPITSDNEHLLRTEYQARNDQELPVLVRYFPSDLLRQEGTELPVALYLDFILYSREQINKENQAMNKNDGSQGSETTTTTVESAPWGIVSIKAQTVDYELPMAPITAMRNALGKEEGGSGVPLNREQYMAAVDYWSKHANVS